MTAPLTPRAATILVSTLREELTKITTHIHAHNTMGTGVTYIIAAANSVSNVVDAATDAMSSLTSQPPLGDIVLGICLIYLPSKT